MLHNLAKAIPADCEPIIVELVERIGRLRALNDDESILLERVLKRERDRAGIRIKKRVWTKAEKAALLKAAKLRGGVKKFAIGIGIEERTAWHMLRNLRNGIKNREGVKG